VDALLVDGFAGLRVFVSSNTGDFAIAKTIAIHSDIKPVFDAPRDIHYCVSLFSAVTWLKATGGRLDKGGWRPSVVNGTQDPFLFFSDAPPPGGSIVVNVSGRRAMPSSPLEEVLRHLRRSLGAQAARAVSDAELLARFVDAKDDLAAAVLVERHGPMVFGVCRRVLGDVHDAEDAFQATFLVLARRAGTLHRRQSLAGWLYAVAQRVALRARARATLRQVREKGATTMRRAEASDDPSWGELRSVLDEEMARLPEKYRTPLVLCYFQGKHYSEAAKELGLAKSSLGHRVARGRELLRNRLVRRGITLSAGGLAVALTDNAVASTLPALCPPKRSRQSVFFSPVSPLPLLVSRRRRLRWRRKPWSRSRASCSLWCSFSA
jgi:RNA polymerase sigma factor (sigma-70 family)